LTGTIHCSSSISTDHGKPQFTRLSEELTGNKSRAFHLLSMIVATLFVPVSELLMKRFAVQAVLLSSAVGDECSAAPGAGFLVRPDHFFFLKQLCPDDPIQFRIDRQNAFQKVITVNSPVMNRRIPGIDNSTLSIFDTFPIDVIAAFPVRYGPDLPDQHVVHSLSPRFLSSVHRDL